VRMRSWCKAQKNIYDGYSITPMVVDKGAT